MILWAKAALVAASLAGPGHIQSVDWLDDLVAESGIGCKRMGLATRWVCTGYRRSPESIAAEEASRPIGSSVAHSDRRRHHRD